MGAKTWMFVASEASPRELLKGGPALDRDATLALAKQLFPFEKLSVLADGSLADTCPPDGELVIGCFPNLTIVAAKEFGIDFPSRLPESLRESLKGRITRLHAMHSAVDWLAFAVWEDGQLVRSLSLSPDSGVMEDIGSRLPFEEPFWAGLHPALDPDEDPSDYPFVFHPLELGEAALLEFFGYQLEGAVDASQLDPERIELMRFKRSASWWRFW